MEGFLQFKIRPWLRRLITRLIAIIPAVIVIAVKGERGSYDLLILSQVVLSLQLPFAIIPLIKFTSDRGLMGGVTNRLWVKVLAWVSAAVVVGLNTNLIIRTLQTWIGEAGEGAPWLWMITIPIVVSVALLLIYVSLPKGWRSFRRPAPQVPSVPEVLPQIYRKVGVAIDFGALDGKVLSHALTLAQHHGATLFLFHVVEGVSGQLFGNEAADDEARGDRERLEEIAAQLRKGGSTVETALGFGRAPQALVTLSRESGIDVLVMGGHGHRGLKDILFGASISEVRHTLQIPVLVVQ
jgi:manganese transport protein